MNRATMILTYSPEHGWHVTDLELNLLATFPNLDEAFRWYSNGGRYAD
jgi:hypothetical protein